MEYRMKRKQFHMTNEDEKILKELAQNKGMSEAEIVRESAEKNLQKKNPLLEMAEKAERNIVDSTGDLSLNLPH